ncbi:hypothetical protein DXG01_008177 [Tephrocybe rancida]|nr:hypothetical protein DXG01_008177 [Tephrocybe rancida]
MILVSWGLNLAVNGGVTSLIVYRLYTAGTSISGSGLSKKRNRYTSSILTIAESGLILASAIVVMVGMFIANKVATAAAVDVVTQIATLSPLLIMYVALASEVVQDYDLARSVRVGFGLTHGQTVTQSTTVLSTFAAAPGSMMLDRSGAHGNMPLDSEFSPLPKGKDHDHA